MLRKLLSVIYGSKSFDVSKYLKNNYGDEGARKILKLTGPKKLKICNENEDTLTLAVKAYKKLKISSNYKKKIKNLIFVTETTVQEFPGNGFIFASKVDLSEDLNIYDINAGCTGFVDALKIANNFKNPSLIVCSEFYSKNIKFFSRNLSTLFSDAASVFIFDKKKIKIIESLSGYKKNSYKELCLLKNKNIYMDGMKVFEFASTAVAPKIEKLIKKYKNKKLKKVFLHQGSQTICNFFRRRLKSYNLTIPENIKKRGNSVSCTLPSLIKDYNKNNNFLSKEKILLCGFGVGLSFSAVVIEII